MAFLSVGHFADHAFGFCRAARRTGRRRTITPSHSARTTTGYKISLTDVRERWVRQDARVKSHCNRYHEVVKNTESPHQLGENPGTPSEPGGLPLDHYTKTTP